MLRASFVLFASARWRWSYWASSPCPLNAPNAAAASPKPAVLLTEDGYGHLTMNDPSQCIDQARTRYLVSLTSGPRGTVCKADKPPFS